MDDPESRTTKRIHKKSETESKLAEHFEEVNLNESERETTDKHTAEDSHENEAAGVSHQDDTKHDERPEAVDSTKEASESKATAYIKGILKRAHPKKFEFSKSEVSEQPDTSADSPPKAKCCHPFVDKLKTMADKQLTKAAHLQKKVIKRVHLRGDEKIVLEEPQEILRLKESPKADRKEIASYIVKQDSDDTLDLTFMEESPSEARKRRDEQEKRSSIVTPDEIIELSKDTDGIDDVIVENELTCGEQAVAIIFAEEVRNEPPSKAPRKKKEHVYEEIDDKILFKKMDQDMIDKADPVVAGFMENLSLKKEDEHHVKELRATNLEDKIQSNNNLLQPLSSIDSASSDEDRKIPVGLAQISAMESMSEDEEKKEQLSVLQEESDVPSDVEATKHDIEPLASTQKSDALPMLDKKVTFTSSTDEEPHREDVELPDHLNANNRWSKIR